MDDPGEQIHLLVTLLKAINLSWGLLPSLLALAVLLLCSALISGAEVAYFSLTPNDKRSIEENPGRVGNTVLELMSRPKRLLATILIGNNFVNVAIVILSTYLAGSIFAFEDAGPLTADQWNFVVNIVAVTFLIVLFGEVIPKVYANRYPINLASFMAFPILAMEKLFQPLSYLLMASTSLIDKRFQKKGSDISVDDLSHALDLTKDDSVDKEEQKILEGIVKFGNTDVKQIMKSRVDVESFDLSTTYPELLQSITESAYSRLPVYRENFDAVEGVLYVKDLLPHLSSGDDFEWQKLIRQPFFVPENKKIDDLLREFQERKIHMAIVVDEYGGTSGIVTLEDVIEEIVGDITDEFDDDDLVYSKLDDRNYVFEAKILMNDFCKVLDLDETVFEDAKGDSETLAGLLLELAGRIPKNNQKVHFKDFIFTVEASDRRRIKRVKVTLGDGAMPAAEPETKSKSVRSVAPWLIGLGLTAATLTGCSEDFAPKPSGFFRIDLPEHTYQTYDGPCPFTFDYSTYAEPRQQTSAGNPCWINIHYPKFKGTVHLSYLPVDTPLAVFTKDSRTLAYKHAVKANDIREIALRNEQEHVYGLAFEIEGEAASQFQFYLTDSTNHFLRGALYFEVAPNADSLVPVSEFVVDDIGRFIQSFAWKE